MDRDHLRRSSIHIDDHAEEPTFREVFDRDAADPEDHDSLGLLESAAHLRYRDRSASQPSQGMFGEDRIGKIHASLPAREAGHDPSELDQRGVPAIPPTRR